ncbi:Hypothetical protein ORPV_381 [Orpheovirus IHUMI-LCC2]|uniref:Uncharacterized protein n=1 Tax=Orpheovirus IHUMI-LCC2 TaxID=2023057 RepID=A0A2I2L404_9VIRU|nr:Hypothetical protein ORPV_381 [Orpheovirus IHUMI-LCC2]SNW62285.1 Hypothetical protein ORPV_381 [Orpheovirus IHUMI-LCC2]
MEYIILPADILKLISTIDIKCLRVLYNTSKDLRILFDNIYYKTILINKYICDRYIEYKNLLHTLPMDDLITILSIPKYLPSRLLQLRNIERFTSFINNPVTLSYISSFYVNIFDNDMNFDDIKTLDNLEKILLYLYPDSKRFLLYESYKCKDVYNYWTTLIERMTYQSVSYNGDIQEVLQFCRKVEDKNSMCNIDIKYALYRGGYDTGVIITLDRDFWCYATNCDKSIPISTWKIPGNLIKACEYSPDIQKLIINNYKNMLEVGKNKENVDMYYFLRGWNKENINDTPCEQLFNWTIGYMFSDKFSKYDPSLLKTIYMRIKEFDDDVGEILYKFLLRSINGFILYEFDSDNTYRKGILNLYNTSKINYNYAMNCILRDRQVNRDYIKSVISNINNRYSNSSDCHNYIRLVLLERNYAKLISYLNNIKLC